MDTVLGALFYVHPVFRLLLVLLPRARAQLCASVYGSAVCALSKQASDLDTEAPAHTRWVRGVCSLTGDRCPWCAGAGLWGMRAVTGRARMSSMHQLSIVFLLGHHRFVGRSGPQRVRSRPRTPCGEAHRIHQVRGGALDSSASGGTRSDERKKRSDQMLACLLSTHTSSMCVCALTGR